MLSQAHGSKQPKYGTWFAPAERATKEKLEELAGFCLHNPVAHAIIDSVDGYVLILNQQRQVLAANPEVLKALNIDSTETLLGLRPGELFGCAFSGNDSGGCGTSKNCTTCGAVISILASQQINQPSTSECLMSIARDGKTESHEFKVRATPILLDNHPLTIFVVNDISASKRRDALENIFIHDMGNLLTGLQGWSEILTRRPDDASGIAQKIVDISSHLTREFQNQRLLLQAERGDLKVSCKDTSVVDILDGISLHFSDNPADKLQRLNIVSNDSSESLFTSPQLLIRVLANMVKNALEATVSTERILVWFEVQNGQPCFFVHNPGKIPDEIALQIFKRSFSTKGSSGRGLGTYSMKLFGEQYLGGQVGFTTDTDDGTRFFIKLPAR